MDSSNPASPSDYVFDLVASPLFASDNICYAARRSGLFVSEDGGKNWRSAYVSLALREEIETTSIALSPDFPSDRILFAGLGGGILHSEDGGVTWISSILPSPPPIISSLVTSPSFGIDGTVFAGTLEDGVFRSTDRGANWVGWNFGLLDRNISCLAVSPDFAHDQTLFAGVESGIFCSRNRGRSWRELGFLMDEAPVLSLAIPPGYASFGYIFAGTESSGLFISEDAGNTWMKIDDGSLEEPVSHILLSEQYPKNPGILIPQGARLFASIDGGKTWQVHSLGLSEDVPITAMIAPVGIEQGAPILLGLEDGNLLRFYL